MKNRNDTQSERVRSYEDNEKTEDELLKATNRKIFWQYF